MNLINTARIIAERQHYGQFRRDGKTPYIYHVQDVAERVTRDRGTTDETIAAAWLHDTLEDTQTTPERLLEWGIPESVIIPVKILSKNYYNPEDYETYSNGKYIQTVYNNYIARKVKIEDILSNLSDNPTNKQIIRYSYGLIYLLK